jgi:hypothetical protein
MEKGRLLFYHKLLVFIITIFSLIFSINESEAYEPCDSSSIRQCIGRALTIEQTSGETLQYVVVQKTESWEWLDSAMTVEMFIKPEREDGKVQFVAGRWGPGEDINDQWVIYFDVNEDLVFEINGSGTNLGSEDNTIVRIPGSGLFDNWNHLAAIFDGSQQTAYIYINGKLAGSARNDEYPVSRLRKIANDPLPMHIGSSNAITNNFDLYRTLKGQIDEVIIWSKAFDATTINCIKDQSYNDKVPDMVLYYRCNEFPDIFTLCDVTGNGNYGKCLNGAACQPNDRVYTPQVVLRGTASVTDTIQCESKKTYYFTLEDTSECGSRIYLWVYDDVDTNYSWDIRYYDLEPKTPRTIPIHYENTATGTYNTRLRFYHSNRCRSSIWIPMSITRITKLKKSTNDLDYGMEYARCINKPYIDSVVTIYNETLNEPIEVFSMTTSMPEVFRIMSPAAPFTVPPGGSQDITVRYFPGDTTAIYMDTLRIVSEDTCRGSGDIALWAHTQEVIELINQETDDDLDSLDFGTLCRGWISDPLNYTWMNLIDVDIEVTDVVYPDYIVTNTFKFPETLEPQRPYLPPNYIRFNPQTGESFRDSIVFKISADGCLIEHPVYFTGEGFFADVGFVQENIDFGDVIIGQDRELDIDVFNNSEDPLTLNFYLRRGKVYFFASSRTVTVPAGGVEQVRLRFAPTAEEEYFDEICLFDKRCLTSACIPVRGRGVLERFRFEPEVMYTRNVIACRSQLDTLAVYNNTSSPLTIRDIVFNNLPDMKYLLEYPNPLPGSMTIGGNDSAQFIFRYAPNDLTTDRADRAYLEFKTEDNKQWSANLYGTSTTPRVYVTYETVFGVVEVGDSRLDTVLVENSSTFPITIDSIEVNNGFRLVNIASGYLGRMLQPRDSMMVIVEFNPTEDKQYNGEVFVYSSDPCDMEYMGVLTGRGIIMPLDVPLSVISFGFTNPCNCIERRILLVNNSLVFPRTIDSIWIDDEDLSNGTPEFFSWRSHLQPGGILPYDVPPKGRDTIFVKFCPRTPAERQFIDNEARIHFKASGTGWEGDYFDTYLIGKRQLPMEPSPLLVLFPWTPVDVTSLDRLVTITIPEVEVNPNRENLKLEKVTFLPDERVFYAEEGLGADFPLEIDSTGQIELAINFTPRAPRLYNARLELHFSEPCSDIDTTVLLSGRGTALPFDLMFTFNPDKKGMDTLRVAYCDTLEVPIYSTRKIPATVIDIKHRIGYDTTKMTYVDSYSRYMEDSNICGDFYPDITTQIEPSGGTQFLLKNFCQVDSINPVAISRYVPNIADRDTFKIYLDSLYFDTEDIIYYELLARPDSAVVVVLKPEMKIENTIDFGVVDVLDYKDTTLMIVNTGDTEITFDDVLNLPEDVSIINSDPPLGDFFDVGDTAYVTLRFQPRRKQEFDTLIYGLTDLLCPLIDSTTVAGEGFAPEFEVAIDVSNNFTIPDTLEATIGDTISVPIIFEKDFSRDIRGVMYWLRDLRFDVNMRYNSVSLMYLGHQSLIETESDFEYSHGDLLFKYYNVDSLSAGEIARVEFLVVVPDSINTSISLDSKSFDTDSVLFLDIIPVGTESTFISNGRLNLTYLQYGTAPAELKQNSPNPWSEATEIEFILEEELDVTLKLYNQIGDEVDDLMDGVKSLPKGKYKAEINSAGLKTGLYYYELRAGGHVLTKKMILVK